MSKLAGIAAGVAVGVLAVGVPVASAANAVKIGTNGAQPVIAVDSSGVGHIVWEDRTTGGVQSCNVPAGATTCTAALLSTPVLQAGGVGTLNIFAPTPSHVLVYGSATGCNGPTSPLYSLLQYDSTDGGGSFAATCRTGALGAGVTPTRGKNWLDTTGRFISGGGAASGLFVLGIDPTGDITDNQQDPSHQIFSTENFYDVSTAVGGSGAGSYLVAAAYSLSSTQPGIVYSVFNQPPDTSSTADLGDATKWTTGLSLAGTQNTIDPPDLISGPSGLFIVYHDQHTVGNDSVGVAKFDPATRRFGAALRVEGDASDTSQTLDDAFQDPSGRLHLIWDGTTGTRYAVSTDGGKSFSAPVTLTTDKPIFRDFATAANGNGWIVYIGDTDNANSVQLIPITQSGAAKTTTVTTPGASIGFGVPNTCVQPGSTFKVTLKWKRQKRKGNLFVKVTRADFYIGAKVAKIDKRAPFVQTLKVTASAKRGSKITLRARAFIKVTHGKVPKKSIKSSINVCA